MSPNRQQTVRINFQIDTTLRREVEECARERGESLSAFFREGAKAHLAALKKDRRNRLLAEGYREMAQESLELARDFEPVDLEGWE